MKKRDLLKFIFIIFIFIFSSEKQSEGLGFCKHYIQCHKWIKTFFKLSVEEQIQKFSTYTVEEQYTIYICGNEIVHPPAMYLATPFAKGGKNTVDFLLTKILQTKDDLVIRDIILVFTEIDKQGTYNVKEDKKLIEHLRSSVAKMKDENWRKISEQMIIDLSE